MEDVRGFEINVLRRFGHVMYGLLQCHPLNASLSVRFQGIVNGKTTKDLNFYTPTHISILRNIAIGKEWEKNNEQPDRVHNQNEVFHLTDE